MYPLDIRDAFDSLATWHAERHPEASDSTSYAFAQLVVDWANERRIQLLAPDQD